MAKLVTLNTILFLILASFSLSAKETKSPQEVVHARMEAHNSHNLEKFLTTYAEDVRIYQYPNKQVGKTGKAHIKRIFAPLFKNKGVHTKVISQMMNGNHVVNREEVIREGKIYQYISIYEVINGKIQNVRFIHQ